MGCAICGNEIQTTGLGWDEGNNAEPVVMNGRCCDACDTTVVLPARLELAGFDKANAEAIGQALSHTLGKLLVAVTTFDGVEFDKEQKLRMEGK